MRVEMRAEISGTHSGRRWPGIGGHVDLPEAEAHKLIAAGIAAPAPAENAAAPAAEVSRPGVPETAVAPAPKRRGRPKLPRDAQGNIIRK